MFTSKHLISTSIRPLFSTRLFTTTATRMTVREVKSLPEFQQAITFEGLTVVDFYATWCGPCKAISPVLEKLSNNFTQAQFIKVDVDAAADVAQEYAIRAMPTFFFFKNGVKIDEVVGANPGKIQAVINANA